MALLTCTNTAFGYDAGIVVEDLNFAVEPGMYLCIVGENGSGKSTLIKGLLGLKNPQKGTIEYGDGLTATEIGYLPQQTAAQKDFPASVYEVVLSGFASKSGLRPFYTRQQKQRAVENMELLQIADMKRRCYRELSGGQQQRVLLARALCATTRLLLLDEPVAGLDPLVTQSLYSIIKQINEEKGITVLMVSHDIRSAVQYASHILHLNHRQAFWGTTENYLHTDLAKLFLGGDA